MDFYNFLIENNFKITANGPSNKWAATHKNPNNKIINSMRIFFSDEFLKKIEQHATNDTKEFILNNLNTNPGCRFKDRICNGKENQVIFGKMFDKVCGCNPLSFRNPSGKTLEFAKIIALMNKNIVDDVIENNT